jgi:hypothetical protein
LALQEFERKKKADQDALVMSQILAQASLKNKDF